MMITDGIVIDNAPYIDKRNVALWEELKSSDFSIAIAESFEPNYGCYCKGKEATIYVLTSKPDSASFAHELLHIKFCINGMFAGCCLKRMIQEHPILKDVITQDTIELITNCMEHVKMLPQFLAMGYSNAEFIADYNSCKMNLMDFSVLCNRYMEDKIPAMDRFLGTYCAMRADNNPEHDYNTCFGLMKQLDSPLFEIVERFWNNWLRYDAEKHREAWESDYGPLISEFVNELGGYYAKRVIIHT